MHYRPGIEIVPGYRLQKMLGRGGFGEVWQAEGPGRVSAAVKIIDKVEEKAGRKEFRALKLIKDLRHPNLVSITGFWLKDADGRLLDSDAYIDDAATSSEIRPSELVVAMDLCEKSLLDRLAECRKGLAEETPGGIPLDELLEYMEAAAKAIDYLNTRHQIQHRDIKPHNIMIVGGSAQVCDFGLASAISTARTSMGGAGSLAYMAPEVYSTKLPSGATDQYSLAITYCELRTGRLPLSDVESFAVLDDAKRKGMLDLSLLDERERGPILRAASLDPAARFATCYDMVQDLRRAMSAGFSVSAPARAEPIAGYQLDRSLRDRDGEQIWDAIDPDGLHVSLVVRTLAEAPGTADWATLSAVREVSRNHPRLAEIYEFAFLSATDKVLPARLFKLPNPPAPTKTIVASRKLPNNLSERLSLGGMAIKRLLLLLGDLAEALDYLNATQHGVDGKMFGFQHTNVRPVNFLLDDDRAVLSNFAGAVMLAGDEADFPAGKQLPDSAFSPPEFAAGKITRWSDQYMLAVSYLQLRTGKPSASLSSSTGSGRRPDARSRLDTSELKPREREILTQATDANPKKRYPTCREFAAALGRAWDEILAAEAPRAEPESPQRKSTHDPAAATLDAAAVASVSLSSVRDSAQTTLEPAPKAAPRHGATLVPSAIETRPPHDTNPDEHVPPPQRVADKPHRGTKPPKQKTKQSGKQQTKPQPAAATVTPVKPWWQSRGAILAGIAIAALAVAIPIALSGGGDEHGKGGGVEKKGKKSEQEITPNVDPAIVALESEIKGLMSRRNFAAAFDTLANNREKLGDTGDALADELTTAWTSHVEAQVTAAATGTDQRLLQNVAGDAALLLGRIPDSTKGRAALAATAQALLGLYKKDLAKPELPKAESARIATGAEVLSTILSAVKAPDPAAIAAAKLVKARAALRAEDSSKAKAALAQIDAKQFADSRDKALCDTLKTLVDEKLSIDDKKLTSLKAMYQNRLDRWELDKLRNQIEYVQGGELAKLKARWAELVAELRPKTLESGPVLADTRKRLVELPTAEAPIWKYLTNPANAEAYRAYRGMLMLATLRLDGLPEGEYARQLEDLSERINVERVGDDAAALCAAALERALAIESTLGYNDAAKTAEAQRLIGLARSTAKTAAANFNAHAAAITESLANTDRRRVELAVKQLRMLRDEAEFAALKSYAEGVAGALSNNPAAEALRSACVVECRWQEKKRPSVAERDALRASVAAAEELDKDYVAFVAAIAREETLSSRLADAADAIQAAYAASGPHLRWRDDASRKTPAVERLEAAAKAQGQGELAKLAPAYYSPESEAAKKSAAWLTTAVSFFPAQRSPTSEAVFRRLRQLQALATYYAKPKDNAAAKQVAAWTDELLAGDKASETPLHVVLVNAMSHAASGERGRAAIVYRRLFDACRTAVAKDAKTGPTPKEIDEHVLAPALTAIGGVADAAKLQGEPRQAAARLFAASGRYAHLYPVVQARVRKQLDAAGKKAELVAKAAFDWFDTAVKLDPTRAEYLYGRGYSCDFRLDMSYAERAKRMEEDANAALAAAGEGKPFPAAHALRGLGLYYRSLTFVDFAKKVEALSDANEAYKKAISMHDALSKAPASAGEYAEMEEDYPAFLVGRGFVLLLMANYESDPAKVESLLAESLKLGLSVTKDTTASEAPTHFFGIHPESAYHLVGNALEDYGWLLKRPEYYPLALVQFSKAEGAATRFENPAGANLSAFYRGRCRFKLAVDGYAATANVLAEFPPAEAQKKAREALVADLRAKGSVAIKDAAAEISQYIESADEQEADLNEAHAFLALIHLENTASDSYDACMASFAKAVKAAERNAHSPTNRQELLLQQADAAVEYARRAKVVKDNNAVIARCKKAAAIAESLAVDEKVAAVTRARAYLSIANAKSVEGPEFLAQTQAALAKAIELAKMTDDGVYGTALWQRGELAVQAATRVKPLGAAEHDLLVDAAVDYFAAIDEQAPLSAVRLKYANSLAHVVSALLRSTLEYPKKAALAKEKTKYASKVAEVARQIEKEYAARLDVRSQVVMADVSNSLVDHAAGLIADESIKPKLKAAINTARDKATSTLEKWPTLKPTIKQ
jgi:serine/threonine protein kinase